MPRPPLADERALLAGDQPPENLPLEPRCEHPEIIGSIEQAQQPDTQIEQLRRPTAQRHGMGVLTFSPLNGGWLSGHADLSSSHRALRRPAGYDASTPAGALKAAALAKLAVVASEAGLTLPQLATAFVRAHPAVTSVIIGPRTQTPEEPPASETSPAAQEAPVKVRSSGAAGALLAIAEAFLAGQIARTHARPRRTRARLPGLLQRHHRHARSRPEERSAISARGSASR
jgi:hypothetical protein